MDDDDMLMSLEQACALLLNGKARPCTLRAEIRKGELEAESWGRGYRVTPRMIREWRARKRVPARTPPPNTTSAHPAGHPSQAAREAAAQAHFEMILKRPRPPLPGSAPSGQKKR